MTKENIINDILKIPVSKWRELSSDKKCLQGEEGLVHYAITKHIEDTKQTGGKQLGFFSFIISGPKTERSNFIKDLSEEFGKPLSLTPSEYSPRVVFVKWEVKKVTERLQNKLPAS